VRLSSLEPADVTEELLDACRELPNFAPHLHLPLQSGSDAILRRMNRKYTVGQFTRTVDLAREAMDALAVTTDIIVGFPGESDEDFTRTLETARRARFAKIHAFPFSAIRGTAAWEFRHDAPPPVVVKQRMASLGELEADLAGEFRSQFVGETMEGLVERPRSSDGGQCRAMTDRYLTVAFTAPPGSLPAELTGSVASLEIDRVTDDGLAGRMLSAR
jgi:threonylcarbamoyladenosine tRNA methylthiotransferase MtaB